MQGSRVDLARSGVAVGVKAGAPKPDISSVDALKRTILNAKSIGYSTGPSGNYVIALFERLGVADQVKPKLKQTATGVFVGSIIASGEVEIGFQQVSELSQYEGVDYVGPLARRGAELHHLLERHPQRCEAGRRRPRAGALHHLARGRRGVPETRHGARRLIAEARAIAPGRRPCH